MTMVSGHLSKSSTKACCQHFGSFQSIILIKVKHGKKNVFLFSSPTYLLSLSCRSKILICHTNMMDNINFRTFFGIDSMGICLANRVILILLKKIYSCAYYIVVKSCIRHFKKYIPYREERPQYIINNK